MEAALTEDLRLQEIGPLVARVGIVIKDELPDEHGENPTGEHKASHDEALAPSEHERSETVSQEPMVLSQLICCLATPQRPARALATITTKTASCSSNINQSIASTGVVSLTLRWSPGLYKGLL